MVRAHTCLYAGTNCTTLLICFALVKAIVLVKLSYFVHHLNFYTIMESTCVRALPFWLKPFGV